MNTWRVASSRLVLAHHFMFQNIGKYAILIFIIIIIIVSLYFVKRCILFKSREYMTNKELKMSSTSLRHFSF